MRLVRLVEEEAEREELIRVGEAVVKREPRSVAILISKLSDGGAVVVMAGGKAIEAGVHAGRLASRLCEALGGRGGGREGLGQGGVPSLERLEEALRAVEGEIRRSVRL